MVGINEILLKEDSLLSELVQMLKAKEPNLIMEVHEVDKTNLKEEAVVFRLQDAVAAPTIRISILNNYIKVRGVEDACDWVLSELYKNPITDNLEFKEILTRDYILSHVTIRIVNAEKNGHLSEYICRDFLNLLQVLTISLPIPDGFGTFFLTREQANSLGLSEDELFEAAVRNSANLEVFNIGELIRSLVDEAEEEDDEGFLEYADGCPMWVATNPDKLYGACMMLHMDKVAEKLEFDEFYVLPSSVHEVIVFPAFEGSPQWLVDMVQEVNRCAVAPEEYLSDEIYYYSNGKLSIA